MSLKLSILDQSPIFEGESARDGLRHTIELAKRAEQLGFHRFWVSEHHNSDKVAGSSPEVLIAYLAAVTDKIRLGSGGVMLQHYSPYKVAENFNLLANLAPGRIDLGIGRAPGGLPLSTQALQKGVAEPATLEQKLRELETYITSKNVGELQATPIPEEFADIYLLGTSVASAKIAAEAGYPYGFAQFISNDGSVAEEALQAYHQFFNEENGKKPEAILALAVIVADTDEEAEELAKDHIVVKVHLEDGKTLTVTSVKQAEDFGKQANQKFEIEVSKANILAGSKETVRTKLLELQKQHNVNEFIITTAIQDFQKRLHSIELLADVFTELNV